MQLFFLTCYIQGHGPALTQGLYSLSLLAAGLAAGLTADMIKGEEDVVFLVHVDRQLNLYLCTVEQCRHFKHFQLTFEPRPLSADLKLIWRSEKKKVLL